MIGIVLVVVVTMAAVAYQLTMEGAIARDAATDAASKFGAVEGVVQDSNGFTELHRAAEKGVDAVKGLLPEHAKAVNVTDKWGETALFKAARSGKHDAVAVLLEAGADPNIISRAEKVALSLALFNDATQGMESATALIQGGADVNISLKEGNTLLHNAVERGDGDVARFLLTHKADVAAVDSSHGRTPLHLAAALQDASQATQLTRCLIDAGAAVNVRDTENGETPLHQAVLRGHAAVVQALLRAGADVAAEDDMLRRTPLTLARRKKREEIVAMLEDPSSVLNAEMTASSDGDLNVGTGDQEEADKHVDEEDEE